VNDLTVHTETAGEFTLRIYYDMMHDDPRKFYDHCGTMVTWVRNYQLGDEQILRPNEWEDVLGESLQSFSGMMIGLTFINHGSNGMGVRSRAVSNDDTVDEYDGVIFMTDEKIREEWGTGDDNYSLAQKALESEVHEYAQWMAGDVYAYTIERPSQECECCHRDYGPEYVDSCGFFIGYEHALAEGREALAGYVAQKVAS